jgi:hypothetical protein
MHRWNDDAPLVDLPERSFALRILSGSKRNKIDSQSLARIQHVAEHTNAVLLHIKLFRVRAAAILHQTGMMHK